MRRSSSACLISLSVRFSLFSPLVPVQIRVDVYSSVQRLYCQNYCHVARRSRRIKSAYQSVSSPDSTVTLPWLSAICSEGGVHRVLAGPLTISRVAHQDRDDGRKRRSEAGTTISVLMGKGEKCLTPWFIGLAIVPPCKKSIRGHASALARFNSRQAPGPVSRSESNSARMKCVNSVNKRAIPLLSMLAIVGNSSTKWGSPICTEAFQ